MIRPGLGRDRPGGRARQRGAVARPVRPGRAARGRQGRRLRPRRGARRAGPRSTRARKRSASRSWRRASSSATPGSTRRSSCCRSRFPTPRAAWSRTGLTPVVYTARRHRRARQGGRRPRRARAPGRAPQGRHGHASGRLQPRRRGRARGPSGRPPASCELVGRVHPPRGRRRARQPLHRRATRARSTPCSRELPRAGLPTGTVHACEHRGRDRVAGRALRPRPDRDRLSTASRPPTRSRDGSRCSRRWR